MKTMDAVWNEITKTEEDGVVIAEKNSPYHQEYLEFKNNFFSEENRTKTVASGIVAMSQRGMKLMMLADSAQDAETMVKTESISGLLMGLMFVAYKMGKAESSVAEEIASLKEMMLDVPDTNREL